MTENDEKTTPQVEVLQPPPPPAKPPRGSRAALSKLSHIRTELAAVYREARSGKLATEEATRLCYLLHTLARIIEASDFEARITALEQGGQHE